MLWTAELDLLATALQGDGEVDFIAKRLLEFSRKAICSPFDGGAMQATDMETVEHLSLRHI